MREGDEIDDVGSPRIEEAEKRKEGKKNEEEKK